MKDLIIVTGGAGFVGSNLIDLLLKRTKYRLVKIKSRQEIVEALIKAIKNLRKLDKVFLEILKVIKNIAVKEDPVNEERSSFLR